MLTNFGHGKKDSPPKPPVALKKITVGSSQPRHNPQEEHDNATVQPKSLRLPPPPPPRSVASYIRAPQIQPPPMVETSEAAKDASMTQVNEQTSIKMQLCVGNLNFKASEKDVEDFFHRYSPIEIDLKAGHAFVGFESEEDARDALHDMNGEELLGMPVRLEIARGDGVSVSARLDANKEAGSVAKKKDAAPAVLTTDGTIGFASLPHQYVEKRKLQGFQFNVLCVGQTGIGKTTFIESLFNMKLDEFEPCGSELGCVELRSKSMELIEGGMTVRLRIVETAGFGDQLDKDQSTKVIVDYINAQFESYLREELKVKRSLALYDDTRLHVCLYFISPTGHGLKALDVVTMRELSRRVNVIPLVAKADTVSKEEMKPFKQRVMAELKAKGIEIYQFPMDDDEMGASLNSFQPFAVIGSSEMVTREDWRVVRARRYPWGIVEVENEEHCDFVKLREAMVGLNADSLCQKTHRVLYERYRQERLREMNMKDGDAGPKMLEAFQTEQQKQFEEEMRHRMEQWEGDYEKCVEKKQAELKNREESLGIRKHEINDRHVDEMGKLETRLQELLKEKAQLEGKSRDGGSSDVGSMMGTLLGKKRNK